MRSSAPAKPTACVAIWSKFPLERSGVAPESERDYRNTRHNRDLLSVASCVAAVRSRYVLLFPGSNEMESVLSHSQHVVVLRLVYSVLRVLNIHSFIWWS